MKSNYLVCQLSSYCFFSTNSARIDVELGAHLVLPLLREEYFEILLIQIVLISSVVLDCVGFFSGLKASAPFFATFQGVDVLCSSVLSMDYNL